MPLVRVSADVYGRLQRNAVPLVDRPNDVIRRLLDHYEQHGKTVSKGEQVPQLEVIQTSLIPPNSFSTWTPWAGRTQIDGSVLPGLYLLGRFLDSPPAEINVYSREVIYIGITEKQSLRKRWEQFGTSAFARQPAHSGGWTFNTKYCEAQPCKPPPWLFVASMPFAEDDLPKLRPLKQQLLAEYASQLGQLPACNTRSR
jgi:hypothetical protein